MRLKDYPVRSGQALSRGDTCQVTVNLFELAALLFFSRMDGDDAREIRNRAQIESHPSLPLFLPPFGRSSPLSRRANRHGTIKFINKNKLNFRVPVETLNFDIYVVLCLKNVSRYVVEDMKYLY